METFSLAHSWISTYPHQRTESKHAEGQEWILSCKLWSLFPMWLPISSVNAHTSSPASVSSRSRFSDSDVSSLPKKTPLADSGRAIDLCSAISDVILQQLLDRRNLFIAQFGKAFVSPLDNQMRERILSLPEEALSFLDRMHEAELGDLPSLFQRLLMDRVSGPFLVYRTPPTFAYVHKLLLYPRQPVIYLSEAFESAFGWKNSTIGTAKLEPCHILRSEDIVGFQCNVLQECLKNPSVGTVPSFFKSLDVLCVNGTFQPCRVAHYTVRSSDLTPVYGILVAEPLHC